MDTTQTIWHEHLLPRPDFQLAYYEAGTGSTILFLSGGPGDDHSYLRPVANPLTPDFRCVLYDQRGTGRSFLAERDETTLAISAFFEDIEALRIHLKLERLNIVGHSWGATLALMYCVVHPERVNSIALIGLGPLSEELADVAAANRLKPLTAVEREELATLSALRRAAIEEGNFDLQRQSHIRIVTTLNARGLFYSTEAIESHRTFFSTHYSFDPITAKYVNKQIFPTLVHIQLWERFSSVTAAMLVLYGYQDFEPITQAYLLKEQVPHAQLCFLNECGHLPWLEQPAKFYEVLEGFLLTSTH